MSPVSCAYCATMYMRHTLDIDAPKLCNNCLHKEQKRTQKKAAPMSTINILIKFPAEVQHEIEEYCIANSTDFSNYFLDLHYKHRAQHKLADTNDSSEEQPKKKLKK